MFPYPSGSGLHVGHPEGYTATAGYVIKKAVAFAASTLLKSTADAFIVWTGHKTEKVLSLANAMNDTDIPFEMKNNLKIGDYYFTNNDIMFKISIVN